MTASGNKKKILNWTSPNTTETVTALEVWRSQNGGAFTNRVSLFWPGVTTYTDTVTNGATYAYYLIAIDAEGQRGPPSMMVGTLPSGAAPIAQPDTFDLVAGIPANIGVLANDTDPNGDPLRILTVGTTDAMYVATLASNGVGLVYNLGDRLYVVPSAAGTGTITYDAYGKGRRATGTVTLRVTTSPTGSCCPPNVAADAVTVYSDESTLIDVLANDRPLNPGDTLRIRHAFTIYGSGDMTIEGDLLRFTPFPGYVGTESHFVFVSGLGNAIKTATVTITVVQAPQPPVVSAGPDIEVVDTDGNGTATVSIEGNGHDPDGGPVTFHWLEGTTVLALDPALFIELPIGQHTLVLVATDDEGLTTSDEVIVTVLGQ